MLVFEVNAVLPSSSVHYRALEAFHPWPGRIFWVCVSADCGYEDFGFVHNLVTGFDVLQIYAPSAGFF
jgi:hypothetical protein